MRTDQEIAENLANNIAFLSRSIFNNEEVPVYVIPSDNKEWADESGIAFYSRTDDYYAVIVKNIYKLKNTSACGLFGTATHEVRHRFQKKFPNSILSKEFLIKSNLLKEDFMSLISNLNKNIPTQDFNLELDSMIIEEVVRNRCKDLTLEQIIENKTEEIVSFLKCNESTFQILFDNN